MLYHHIIVTINWMRVVLPAIFGMPQVHIKHTLIYEREKERDEHRTENKRKDKSERI
jgi:hypothetical protein